MANVEALRPKEPRVRKKARREHLSRKEAESQLPVIRAVGQDLLDRLHIWEGLLSLEEKYGPSPFFDDARTYLSDSKKRREDKNTPVDKKTPRSAVVARDEWTEDQVVPVKKSLGLYARVPDRDDVVRERARTVVAPQTGLSPEFHEEIADKYIKRSIKVQVKNGVPEGPDSIQKSA